jgi:hypothetical protein
MNTLMDELAVAGRRSSAAAAPPWTFACTQDPSRAAVRVALVTGREWRRSGTDRSSPSVVSAPLTPSAPRERVILQPLDQHKVDLRAALPQLDEGAVLRIVVPGPSLLHGREL